MMWKDGSFGKLKMTKAGTPLFFDNATFLLQMFASGIWARHLRCLCTYSSAMASGRGCLRDCLRRSIQASLLSFRGRNRGIFPSVNVGKMRGCGLSMTRYNGTIRLKQFLRDNAHWA